MLFSHHRYSKLEVDRPPRTPPFEHGRRWQAASVLVPAFLFPILLPALGYLFVGLNWHYDQPRCSGPTIFGITHTFGRLSFAEAKWIDVAWDAIVGRGGQAGLAWIAYRVIQDSLVDMLERRQVSVELFTTLSTGGGSSMMGLVGLAKELWRAPGLRRRVGVVMFCTAYVIVFPTAISAMTGYVTQEDTHPILQDETSITMGKWEAGAKIVVLVHQEGGVGGSDASVELEWMKMDHETSQYDTFQRCYLGSSGRLTFLDDQGETIYTIGNLTYNAGKAYPGEKWGTRFDGHLYPGFYPWDSADHRQCVSNEYYEYGIASTIWQLTCLVQIVWTYAIYVLYVHTHGNSKLCLAGRRLGAYRAIEELGTLFAGRMGEGGYNAETYGEGKLERWVKKKCPSVKYVVTENDDGTFHAGLTVVKEMKEVGTLKLEERMLH
jgi:hypothetical protein